MNPIEFDSLNGTPVFVSPDRTEKWNRVFGAVFDKRRDRWLWPAYPPLASHVVEDIQKVGPTTPYSPAAQAHVAYLATVPDLVARRVLPSYTSATPPFDHQVEGLAHLYHYPRFGLLWDAGTGKTRVLIDLLQTLRGQRMLTLCPRAVVENWVQEVRKHAGTGLKAVALIGTPAQKRKIIAEHEKYDLIAASYGTARTLATEVVHKKAISRIRGLRTAGRLTDSGVRSLAKAVRQYSDPAAQESCIDRWERGASFTALEHESVQFRESTAQWLEDVKYQIIAADESHSLQDPGSQQTKAALALSKKAPRRYIVSGTAALGDPRHLYAQLRFLAPANCPEDWYGFMNKFLVRSEWNKHMVIGFQNLHIINKRVQRVSIKKTKEECLDLPSQTVIDVKFPLSPEQQRLYNTLVAQMEEPVDLSAFFANPSAGEITIQNAAVKLNKLSQVVSGFVMSGGGTAKEVCNGCPHLSDCVQNSIQPYTSRCKIVQAPEAKQIQYTKENPKLEQLDELLSEILSNPTHKVIIWTVYKAELAAVKAMLEKKKLGHVVVEGQTRGSIQARIDEFNTDPACRVYLGQIATGVGITLNAATYMIYYSLDWSLGTYLQSIDRNYRAGQTEKVTVYRLLGRGTVDEYKAAALDQKKDISATLTNKISCATCPKRLECLNKGVELFDPDCIHKRSARKTVARAKVI